MKFFDMKYVSKVSRSECLWMCHVNGKADFDFVIHQGPNCNFLESFLFSKSALPKVEEKEAGEDVD